MKGEGDHKSAQRPRSAFPWCRGLIFTSLSLLGCAKPAASREVPPESALQTRAVVAAGCGMPAEVRESSWPRDLEPSQKGPPDDPEPGGVTLAVLPDTQYYSSCLSELLRCQASWVEGERERRRIIMALSLGDLTEHNTQLEWDYVKDSLSPLLETVPVVLASGNHDHGDDGTANRRGTLLQRTFPEAPEAARPLLTRTLRSGDLENAYYRFSSGDLELGVLVLEWSPRDHVVDWANDVVEEFPDDRVILVTHAYVYYDDSRYDWRRKGTGQRWNPRAYGTALKDPEDEPGPENWLPEGANDGEMLWEKLVRRHPGFFLTLSGHVLGDGQGLVSSRGDAGNLVHQVLVNYQMLDRGGLGYLRLIELGASGTTMKMTTYSPALDRSATGPDQMRVLPIEPPLL